MTTLPLQHPKYWLTLVWAGAIVQRARKEGRIKEDFAFQTIIKAAACNAQIFSTRTKYFAGDQQVPDGLRDADEL